MAVTVVAGMVVAGMAAAGVVVAGVVAAGAVEAGVGVAGDGAAVGVRTGVGVRIGGLTTSTGRVAAGCACGFCAIIIGCYGASGVADNDSKHVIGFRRHHCGAVFFTWPCSR